MRGGKYILGLDVGTTKVCAVVGAITDGQTEVAGIGLTPCSGLRKGTVVDMEATTRAIKEAVQQAEDATGVSLKAAYVGIAGGHIKCRQSYGATAIRGREVTKKDVRRVMDSASVQYVPLDREILHILPVDFAIDGQAGIVRPEGMSGVRLEATVNVVTASHSCKENLVKCTERAGLRVAEVVLEPLASAKAVLKQEELQSGALLIDLGGGTTTVAVYKEDRLVHTFTVPMAGMHLTNDTAIGLRVSLQEAEKVKKMYGLAHMHMPGASEEMTMFDMNGEQKKISRRHIVQVLGPRCREIMHLVRQGLGDTVPYCAVITGGSSGLAGLDRLAEGVLGIPTRCAAVRAEAFRPRNQEPNSPAYSTAVGLMLHGMRQEEREADSSVHEDILQRIYNRAIRVDYSWVKRSVKQTFRFNG